MVAFGHWTSPFLFLFLLPLIYTLSCSPLATGNGLFSDGHMDGGFSLLEHPKCTKSVTLPLDARLMINSLNVNMGIDEAYRLWNQGLAYGL